MSSHQLAIAKASFSAGLLRPDPASVSRDEIAHFHTVLNLIAVECSPANIQKCKRWILRNVIQSTARAAAFGKYLIALSISFSGPAKSSVSAATRREPSAKRRRIHLLYLINDILHHAKYHSNDASVARKLQTSLIGLFGSAASFRHSPRHQRKIEHLLQLWEEAQYYSTAYIGKIREAVKIAPDIGRSLETSEYMGQGGEAETGAKSQKNTPFSMPAMHGDQSTPWYDLPAGNMMPHIVPNSTRPINPTLVRPLRFMAGPADEIVANAVRNLLSDVEKIFGTTKSQNQYEDVPWDIDELGQVFLRDEITGAIRGAEGYYGWSKAFCEKSKRHANSIEDPSGERHRESEGISHSRSTSRNSSRRSRRVKRRRYSDSEDDRSRSRGRSRNRSRIRRSRPSYSSSESPRRGRNLSLDRQGGTSSGSTEDPASRDMAGHDNSEPTQMPRSQSDHRSADQVARESSRKTASDSMHALYPYGQDVKSIPATPYTLLPPTGHHFASGIIPIPPPPPPEYQGQWPPPPPPSMLGFGQQAQHGGAWPPPTPAFVQEAQNWQATSYGQQQVNSIPWAPVAPSQLQRSDGTYGGHGRGGSNSFQTPPQGVGSGYNGHRGNGRGRGW